MTTSTYLSKGGAEEAGEEEGADQEAGHPPAQVLSQDTTHQTGWYGGEGHETGWKKLIIVHILIYILICSLRKFGSFLGKFWKEFLKEILKKE